MKPDFPPLEKIEAAWIFRAMEILDSDFSVKVKVKRLNRLAVRMRLIADELRSMNLLKKHGRR